MPDNLTTDNGAAPRRAVPTRLFDGCNVGLNSIGTIWILLLMVLINFDIFGRFLFNAPVVGTKEIVEFSIVGIVYLQLGHALKSGKMTRADLLFGNLLTHFPRVAHGIGVLINLLGALFVTLIWEGNIDRLLKAWERDYFIGSQGFFTIPLWPLEALLILGCIVISIQFLILAWRHAVGIVDPARVAAERDGSFAR